MSTIKKLADQLLEYKMASGKRIPKEIQEKMSKAIEELYRSNTATGLSEGQQAPDFTLPDATGKMISLFEELKKGPVVLTFYRGGWCPYCNLQLRAYQQALNEIKRAGAQLIAISPESPDHSLTTKEKNDLEFYVLSDVGNRVARSYNLVFQLPSYLIDIYKQLGIDLPTYNQNEDWTLPVPATFIIDPQGVIRKSHIDPDYTKRMEPQDLLQELQSMNKRIG